MNLSILSRNFPTDLPRIIEIGFHPEITASIAKWLEVSAEGAVTSVGLDINKLTDAHDYAVSQNCERSIGFLLQDPAKYLMQQSWADAIFITDTAMNLSDGLTLFRLAASTGARVIVFTNYQSVAAQAIREARASGWIYEFEAGETDLFVLRRK